jgi:hypothetical protein
VLKDGSPANALLTPFKLLFWLLNWVFGQMAWVAIRFEIRSLWNLDWTYAYPKPQEPVFDQSVDYETYSDEYVENAGYGEGEWEGAVENQPVNGVFEENPDDNKPENKFYMKNGGPMPLLEMT